MLSNQEIAEKFDSVANQYADSAYLAKHAALALDQRLALMQLAPQHILDIGCGSGFCLQVLQQRYPKALLVGLDLSAAMLTQVTVEACLCVSSAEQAAFQDASFDLITANLSLLWRDFSTLLNECARLLKPNGLLIFSMLGVDSLAAQRQTYDKHRLRDMHLIGDDLLKCGFEDPVMEVDYTDFHYDHLDLFKQEYHSLGLDEMISLQDRLPEKPQVSFEMIYGHAWCRLPVSQPDTQGEISIPLSKIRRRNEYPF